MSRFLVVAITLWVIVWNPAHAAATSRVPTQPGVLHAGFVCTPGVYNSELMAPYDVLQHSVFRDSLNYILPFIITEDGAPLVSFEGITVQPHYSFANAPRIDILVIPSTEHSMGSDLENERFMRWLAEAVDQAQWVITLCDGAFPLAGTGVLDERIATTFPGDRDAFAARFPKVDVRYDVRMVVDGKYITSVGGAPSYEPAFYLVETLYGPAHARRSGQGLVVDWDLQTVPHLVVGHTSDNPLQSLTWLQGSWVRSTSNGEVVESWTWQHGVLEGQAVRRQGGEERVGEHMRLERLGGAVYYIAHPAENAAPTWFRLVEHDDERFVFENPQHDFPQRIIYTRQADGGLWARIEGQMQGEDKGIDFRFERQSR